MSSTPISLLDRLKEPHDAEAWARFVHLYTPLLYGWARRTGLQEADVADLLQEVFAVLVRELPRFQYRPGGSFRGWLRPALVEAGRLAAVPDPAEIALPGEAEERRQLLAGALRLLEGEFTPATGTPSGRPCCGA